MYSCHFFLISFASVRSIPFLSFIVPILAWNIPLVSLIFLKRSLIFPILLFSSVSLHWSLRKVFLSILAILWNSSPKWEYLFFSPLPFTSLLFSAIFKTSSDNHFAFLHFFFLETFLITTSFTMSWHCNGTLLDLILWIYLPFPLYNCNRLDLGHSILKCKDITLPIKIRLVKAMVFPAVMYGWESQAIKKAECQRIDAFELWCWRRLLRVP